MAVLPVDIRDRLESTRDTVIILIKKIKDGQAVSSFGEHAHSQLTQTASLVSDACTKLAVIFSKPPLPSLQECGTVCTKVEHATLMLVTSLVHSEDGKTLYREVQSHVLNILNDLEQLLSTVMSEGCSRSVSQLHKTGSLWKNCEAMSRLSRDNMSASLKLFLSQLHLLRDALIEVNQLESCNGVSEDEFMEDIDEVTANLEGVSLNEGKGWTSEERAIVIPCITLVKLSVQVTECASRLLVNRGELTKVGVAEMDCGCDLINQLSPAVDNVASELSSPVAMETCRSMGCNLGDTLLSFVQSLCGHHYCNQTEQWESDKYTDIIRHSLQQLATT